MEALFAVLIVCLVALGLSAGLLMGRAPPRAGCGGASCAGGGTCAACGRGKEEDGR